jgi:hypothetical protein
MMFDLNCTISMRVLLRLSFLVGILIIGSTTLSQKLGESLYDCFARFESIMNSLCSYSPLAYSDNEHAKQLLYAIDDHIWGIKIIALEESTDFATLDIKKCLAT